MRRRLFEHARSFEVDPAAGRFELRPLRSLYALLACACASMGLGPWLCTRLGPYELTTGGWLVVLAYGGATLALAALAASPRNRRVSMDLERDEILVAPPFGLGPSSKAALVELRFGYRERLLPIGDVVSCRASLHHPRAGEITILETTRAHRHLPKRAAYALEEARRSREGRHLQLLADELMSARRVGPRDVAIILATVAVGPAWMWWFLG